LAGGHTDLRPLCTSHRWRHRSSGVVSASTRTPMISRSLALKPGSCDRIEARAPTPSSSMGKPMRVVTTRGSCVPKYPRVVKSSSCWWRCFFLSFLSLWGSGGGISGDPKGSSENPPICGCPPSSIPNESAGGKRLGGKVSWKEEGAIGAGDWLREALADLDRPCVANSTAEP